MKISEKQLRSIIRESLQTLLNESRYYPTVWTATNTFSLEDLDSYMLKTASQEEKEAIMQRYGQPGEDIEDALYRAIETLPEELLSGMEVYAELNRYGKPEVDDRYKVLVDDAISRINDEILKKYAMSYFEDWIESTNWDFREEDDPDYDPDSDVGGYDYDRDF
jgi:hypothetical protein